MAGQSLQKARMMMMMMMIIIIMMMMMMMINQLSAPSRTRVMIVLICCVGAKNDLFPIFVKVISQKPLDLHS